MSIIPQVKNIEMLIRLSAIMGEKEFYSLDEIFEFLNQSDEELFFFAQQNKRFKQTVAAFVKKSEIEEVK